MLHGMGKIHTSVAAVAGLVLGFGSVGPEAFADNVADWAGLFALDISITTARWVLGGAAGIIAVALATIVGLAHWRRKLRPPVHPVVTPAQASGLSGARGTGAGGSIVIVAQDFRNAGVIDASGGGRDVRGMDSYRVEVRDASEITHTDGPMWRLRITNTGPGDEFRIEGRIDGVNWYAIPWRPAKSKQPWSRIGTNADDIVDVAHITNNTQMLLAAGNREPLDLFSATHPDSCFFSAMLPASPQLDLRIQGKADGRVIWAGVAILDRTNDLSPMIRLGSQSTSDTPNGQP
jgi:hypothetical protein